MCIIYIMRVNDKKKTFVHTFVICDNINNNIYIYIYIYISNYIYIAFIENVLILTIQILQQYMIHLSEDGVKVVKSNGTDGQYQIYTAGIYIITEVKGILNLIWDNKTSLMVQLHPKFKVSITPNHLLHLPVHPLTLISA